MFWCKHDIQYAPICEVMMAVECWRQNVEKGETHYYILGMTSSGDFWLNPFLIEAILNPFLIFKVKIWGLSLPPKNAQSSLWNQSPIIKHPHSIKRQKHSQRKSLLELDFDIRRLPLGYPTTHLNHWILNKFRVMTFSLCLAHTIKICLSNGS